jgi:hypothetical protein
MTEILGSFSLNSACAIRRPPRSVWLDGRNEFGPQCPALVVIVGAGFGGLRGAQGLRKRNAPVEATIIDQDNYHTFIPLPYQVATAHQSPKRSHNRSAGFSGERRTSSSALGE